MTRPSGAKRVEMDIQEDADFQRRTWMVQRIAWVFMSALVCAAAFGLFSAGPLSRAQAGDPDGALSLEYQRFARFMAPTFVRLRLEAPATGQARVEVRLNRALAEGLEMEVIRPEPASMLATGDGIILVFLLAEQGVPADVTFNVKPQRMGLLRGEVALIGHRPARLTQFVYP